PGEVGQVYLPVPCLQQVVLRQPGKADDAKEVQSVSFQERRPVWYPLFQAHRGRLPGLSGRVCPPRLRPRIKFEWEVKISRPTRPLARHLENRTIIRSIFWIRFIANPPRLPMNPPERARLGRE